MFPGALGLPRSLSVFTLPSQNVYLSFGVSYIWKDSFISDHLKIPCLSRCHPQKSPYILFWFFKNFNTCILVGKILYSKFSFYFKIHKVLFRKLNLCDVLNTPGTFLWTIVLHVWEHMQCCHLGKHSDAMVLSSAPSSKLSERHETKPSTNREKMLVFDDSFPIFGADVERM